MSENIKELVEYARSMYWTPYSWGGNHPNKAGVDCSGLICQIFRAAGVIGVKDFNAQMLRDDLEWKPTDPKPGAIAFYGKPKEIVHVAFCVTDYLCIEAGGGDQRTRTKWEANGIGACVRLRPIQKRNDFLEVLWPPYPFES